MLADSTYISSVEFAIDCNFSSCVIYNKTPLHFPDMDVRFRMEIGSIGRGVVWLSGYFTAVSGASILGKADYAITTNPAFTEIQISKEDFIIGDLIGTSLNVQSGTFCGDSVSFTKW